MTAPLVRFEAVDRRFGDLAAVTGATLEIYPGEVLALLGENGAGKSTLMKLLYGVHAPSGGRILVDGRDSPIRGPADAVAQGIGMVFQSFSQIPALTVRENLLLAWPKTPLRIGRGTPAARAVLDTLTRLAPAVDPERRVRDLSVGEQQLVELCKVLNIAARLVILDEPTAVLTPAEARRLHGFIRRLADDGVAVVLITHKLADVEACADRIAVMRRGAIVDVSRRGERPMAEVVRLMMGDDAERRLAPPRRPAARVERLHLRALCAEAPGSVLRDVTLAVAAGEIVGVAGVAGNGQALLAEAVAGVAPITSGDIVLDGVAIARRHAEERRTTAIGYIPEKPRENAAVEALDLAANLRLRTLAAGTDDAAIDAPALLARFGVTPAEPGRPAGTLSGGNLQKLVVARELGAPRPAILACYPTMGLDIGAVERIYAEIFAQAAAGAAILWISEDLDDLLAAAHRIAVLREGRIVALLDNDESVTRERVGALMTGMDAGEAAA